jgi:hypothetical protein
MNRSPLRLLPAAASLAAVLFAAAAPAQRAREAAPASVINTGCSPSALAGTNSAFNIPTGSGVIQPFDGMLPLASCSLAVSYPYYSNGRLTVVEWDPLALAPDPTAVALRTRGYNSSELQYNHVRANFTPPIVTEAVAGVAATTRNTLALDYVVTDNLNSQSINYWVDGSIDMPSAFSHPSSGAPVPMPGPHPVLGATFCPGEYTADLRVLQSVAGPSVMLGFGPYEYLQQFRVPERCELQWIEIAFGYNSNVYPLPVGLMGIVDGASMPDPITALPTPIFQADFYTYGVTNSVWGTHSQTAAPITLEPNHDYWLLVRAESAYPLHAWSKTGAESEDFRTRIGPLYSRQTPAGVWAPRPGLALLFRLLGERSPVPLSVSPSAPPGLRLGIEPNPARGAAMVRWSGARGSVRLEVLDPRGRRVAQAEGAGAEGTWSWRGVADDGGPCAPGVYFVRAVDDEGVRGVARLVLIR